MLRAHAILFISRSRDVGAKMVSKHVLGLLKHYVYVYYDKESGKPFYIGKGKNARYLQHQERTHNKALEERLQQGGWGIDFLAYGLDEESALKVEAASIDLIGVENLLNRVRGAGALKYGRIPTEKLIQSLTEEPLRYVPHNLIVVSIKQTYEQYGEDPEALYESTRGIWSGITPERANKAQYLLGVVEGRVTYVMSVAGWFPAGSTNYFVRDAEGFSETDRIEFVGAEAPKNIQELYLGKVLPQKDKMALQKPIYLGPFNNKVSHNGTNWDPQ